ncbi:MAG: glutathione S-transferase N-terminal domain-containing protein [Solirubrobacteraceae bacterium]
MPDLRHPPGKLTLYTCHVGRGGPSFLPHGCRRAHEALDEAGIVYESVIFGKGRPLAIGTTGKRPDLKQISGQEKLPVLALADGTTVNRSDAIVAWAAERKASTH